MTCEDSENSAYESILFYFCGYFAATVFIEKSGQDILQKFSLCATQKSVIWVVNVKKMKLSTFWGIYPFNKHLSQQCNVMSYHFQL